MTTKVVKIDPLHIENAENNIKNAADIIINGGLVAFPTETVYGLGGDGTNPDAAKKIYSAKGRPSDNPLIIHIADPTDAEKYTYTCDTYYRLAEKFMPGPLTVVMKAKDSVPLETRGGLSTVAVRCPINSIANRLIKLAGVPIAAPSANISGSPSPTNAEHVISDLSGRVDMIIDGGECEIGLESTIVKLEDDGGITLLRPGRITIDELAFVAPVTIADAVTDMLSEGQVALSPGMKYRHYAPSAQMVLLDGDIADATEFVKNEGLHNIAFLCYSEDEEYIAGNLPEARLYVLGNRDDLNQQAHHLFAVLRDADKESFEKIYAPLPTKDGVGLALYNRMIRAAAHTIINLRKGRNG